ncbi:MobF family relaxase [Cellvibrio sp. KY-YJ-3]|uniref:MobF family relaxase n=1 Tax=Cellvibrio sp. KY-YJ-3 TaxID=454662 RepID=UPI001245D963|nr:MobF family relaxase [Cellvibrio sp. KY-YJ-3]QEY13282.1 conjugative relaxase [Cellvibrio sp. KY-YJ-3]
MMTLSPIRSVEHAITYYEHSDHADYYAAGETCVSRWAGKGAQSLGIDMKPVSRDLFSCYLRGDIAGQKLGAFRNGENERKPGIDCVLSPPKSVSLAALVGGDERVIHAHEAAVDAAIRMMEKHAAFIREHTLDEYGRDQFDHVATSNLLCGVFRHDTSRSLQPQLHSHIVVINATEKELGVWRSIESRHLYCVQMKVGLHYRQELAANLRKLGYGIRRTQNSSFEIEGFSEDIINAFSSRRDAIDAALDEQGLTRESAPAALKEKLARRLRDKKEFVEKMDLLNSWQKLEDEFRFDSRDVVREAVCRASEVNHLERVSDECFSRLKDIYEDCVDDLFERDSIVSRLRLVDQINQKAVGCGVSSEAIQRWISIAEANGSLLKRSLHEYSSQFKNWREVVGYTTPEIVARENSLLDCIGRGNGAVKSLVASNIVETYISQANLKSQANGYDEWNLSQQTALRGLLQTHASFVALQGYAGTAKTSTVLREFSEICVSKGYEVVGMAPSSSACKSLLEGAGLNSAVTVASHLLRVSYAKNSKKQQVWIVDEASLLSTRDMHRLVMLAEKRAARVVLVGDVQQLGSVEAGAAFRQLQEFGIETFKLDEIVRQQNESALSAVYAGIEGDARKALQLLEGEGGSVTQVDGDKTSRYKKIVESWVSLTLDERDKTLIIDPSRAGRRELTSEIREALKQEGIIGEKFLNTAQVERVDHTRSSRTDVFNYQVGDCLLFGKDYKRQGITKHSYWRIVERNPRKNTLTIADKSGRQLVWNPRGIWGASSQAYRPVEAELAISDKIIWTLNDRRNGLINGMKGVVDSIDQNAKTARISFSRSKFVTVDLTETASLHWSHDYVTTAHAAQGQTADRVIYHAESFRRNLASQKSFYVSISRAKHQTLIITDDRAALEQQISEHIGEKQNAIEQFYCQVM